MENNFEERRKDVDLSNIDMDSHSYQRKKLELDAKYETKANTEMSFYSKERELANNNDDEILRRIKVSAIDNDYANKVLKLQKDYENELKELSEKYGENESDFNYYKKRYIGEVGKYVFTNEKRIYGGTDYYIKLNGEQSKISVYNDAKYSSLVGEILYIPEEWTEV